MTHYGDRVLLELVRLGWHPRRDSEWVRQDRARRFDPIIDAERAMQLAALRRRMAA